MKSFTDNAGRVWTIAINVATVKRVRALLNIDIFKLVDDGFKNLGALIADPVQLADVLYCICKTEADAQKISDEDFGRTLAGDAITLAADAFLEELIDFFPEPKVRTSLRKIVAESKKVRNHLLKHAETVLDNFDAEREANKLIRSFGTVPESSDSILAPSPSANSA